MRSSSRRSSARARRARDRALLLSRDRPGRSCARPGVGRGARCARDRPVRDRRPLQPRTAVERDLHALDRRSPRQLRRDRRAARLVCRRTTGPRTRELQILAAAGLVTGLPNTRAFELAIDRRLEGGGRRSRCSSATSMSRASTRIATKRYGGSRTRSRWPGRRASTSRGRRRGVRRARRRATRRAGGAARRRLERRLCEAGRS